MTLTFTNRNLSVLQVKNEPLNDLKAIAAWLQVNKFTLNLLKTDFMLIGSKQRIAASKDHIGISLSDTDIRQVDFK